MPKSLTLVSLLALALGALPAVAGAADAVGPQACKACHEKAFEVWSVGPHARAEGALGEQAQDPRCLACHAPQKAEGLSAVSCEACHGKGQYYAPSHVMRDPELARAVGLVVPDEKACRVCHDATSPSLDPFVFEAKKALIDHWSEDREARKKRAPAPPPPSAKPKADATPAAPKPAPVET